MDGATDRIVEGRIERTETYGLRQRGRDIRPTRLADGLVQAQAQFQRMGRLPSTQRREIESDRIAEFPHSGIPCFMGSRGIGPTPEIAQVDGTPSRRLLRA